MLRNIVALILVMLLGCIPALAEFPEFENQIPTEPMVTENEFVAVTAEYDAAADLTRYEIRLKEAAQFPDGSPLTAEDLIFSWYVYLDPGYAGDIELDELDIPGLESYRLQMSADSLSAARSTMAAIAKADNRAWSEADPWTKEQHETWQNLQNAYAEACREEYPRCVQSIVDVCRRMLLSDDVGEFGMTAEAVAADEGLTVAYAMMAWGYASCEDNSLLTSSRTRTVWQLDVGAAPTVDDFVAELKAVYDDDLAACWAVETSGAYSPALPDVEAEFLNAAAKTSTDSVPAIEGIRLADGATVEVLLKGIDLRSEGELLGIPMLSRAHFGDSAQWNPEAGLYGHAFGDVSAIENALADDGNAHTSTLVESVSDGFAFTD